jgi:hypothetical protein
MTNKKIKELYIKTIQAKYPNKIWAYDFDEDYAEIFANLIINECIKSIEISVDYYGPTAVDDLKETIKKHFGEK